MNTQDLTIIISTVTILIAIAFIGGTFYGLVNLYKDIYKDRKRNKAILKRSIEVESFRNRMAGKYGYEGLEAMPSEQEMIEDDRELTELNYLSSEFWEKH